MPPLRQFCPDPFLENNSVRGFTAKILTTTTTTTTITTATTTTTTTTPSPSATSATTTKTVTTRPFQNGEL